jgi:bifunctional NMN adenylyltransferase/nudix hydrolase
MTPKLPKTDVGVIIGRFQIDQLHDAHKALVETVFANHHKVVILLGSSPVSATRRNPLDYDTRRLMIQASYPEIITLPIFDKASDEAWSRQVDTAIRSVLSPAQTALIYGGRDSFLPHYRGNFSAVELAEPEHITSMSATSVRARLGVKTQACIQFRAGAIWSAHQHWPKTVPTVDVVILDYSNANQRRMLLGRKNDDPEGKWRFIGGFADPKDASYEVTALREAREETGLEVGTPKYVGSCLIDDWRYRNDVDKIKTILFTCNYIFGSPTPGDDIDALKWFNTNELKESNLVDTHHPLLALLNGHSIPPKLN